MRLCVAVLIWAVIAAAWSVAVAALWGQILSDPGTINGACFVTGAPGGVVAAIIAIRFWERGRR